MTEQERQQHIQVSTRVEELGQEYKEIQFKIRRSMLPISEDHPWVQRLQEISRECWTYGVNIKKFM